MSCLRLTPSNFSKSKIKIFKYRIWLFLAWDFLKSIVIFEISIPEFKKCEFLTHTVNFSTRSIFPKGLRPTFSKDPGRGPGLFYKVCRMRISIMIAWTAQKINFSIMDFLSKCDQIRSFLRISSYSLKPLTENFIFCAVKPKKEPYFL